MDKLTNKNAQLRNQGEDQLKRCNDHGEQLSRQKAEIKQRSRDIAALKGDKMILTMEKKAVEHKVGRLEAELKAERAKFEDYMLKVQIMKEESENLQARIEKMRRLSRT